MGAGAEAEAGREVGVAGEHTWRSLSLGRPLFLAGVPASCLLLGGLPTGRRMPRGGATCWVQGELLPVTRAACRGGKGVLATGRGALPSDRVWEGCGVRTQRRGEGQPFRFLRGLLSCGGEGVTGGAPPCCGEGTHLEEVAGGAPPSCGEVRHLKEVVGEASVPAPSSCNGGTAALLFAPMRGGFKPPGLMCWEVGSS